MQTRETSSVSLPAAIFGDTVRAVLDAHQDLTRHNGAYEFTPDGWHCAVCQDLADGSDVFRVPASGRPPSGWFMAWPETGYEWSDKMPDGSR